jgi:predicted lipoprotein with Yx(FWY)xxD motif
LRTAERHISLRPFVVAAAMLVLLAAAIGAGNALGASKSGQIGVRKTALGSILVDSHGRTLYLFAADTHGKSACYGSCANYWPPLISATRHVTGTGVRASLLTTTRRRDGKFQVTYNGHPLYRYVQDTKPGQTTGQGLDVSGGLWWVVSPAGKAVKNPPSSGGDSGGGGYGGGYGG